VQSDLYHELLDLGQTMRFPIEGLHTETGPGVLEAALAYCDALEAADRAALFRPTQGSRAAPRLMATFMARWSNSVPGQSGHLHISLRTAAGDSAFHDPSKPHEMSDTMRWFIGGQQALMPELLAMVAGTVNSYSRLVPGYGRDLGDLGDREPHDRTARDPRRPVEPAGRVPDSGRDINPYIALAAAIGSGSGASSIASSRTRPSKATPTTASIRRTGACRHAVRSRRTPGRVQACALVVRRPVRRALCRHPAVGKSGIPQGDHRLELARYFEII